MPRSLWKGAVSFGLVTIPVKLYSATEEKDVTFRQVHPKDGGRIKYKRVCEVCGEEVPYAEIAKGYESADGRMVILEASDFDDLPLPTAKQVEIVQFVEVFFHHLPKPFPFFLFGGLRQHFQGEAHAGYRRAQFVRNSA